jgi:chorismate mutase
MTVTTATSTTSTPDSAEASTIPQHSASPHSEQHSEQHSEESHGEKSIADMRLEIDEIDAELVRLIQRRSEISHAIGAARTAEGGTRIVYSREMKVLDRFAALGPAGTELGMLLLSLGRGQLGRR